MTERKSAGYFDSVRNCPIYEGDDKCLVEVEVKISKSDFRREFENISSKNGSFWKGRKHHFYKHPEEAWAAYTIPNKFYFCVPEEMECWALEYLKDKNPKYGLLVYDAKILGKTSKIRLVKGARQLQTEPPKVEMWRAIGIRVTNEMIEEHKNTRKRAVSRKNYPTG